MTIDPEIRCAKPEDIPIILAFMHATAAEQNVAHAVQATESELLNTLSFGDTYDGAQGSRNPVGKALLALDPEGKVAGMAIYFFTYAAWIAKPGVCLEDLFVLPQYRRQGYARLLVQAVAKQAKTSGCVRMEWLCYKENHRALNFYASLGANKLENLAFLRLDQEAMVDLTNGEP
ncbi:acyl-CoA N-acyltransferase [Periconia macrospinosa]|uniref:Acyl-CoA N-acyltransferase n=1 Tax=Periconia macrospinosa TaxID=97972 RepID=A0A2V1DCE6_9PLEO|nr:acyl-CoA N-acyltransferase [Periconia macrospinosa]